MHGAGDGVASRLAQPAQGRCIDHLCQIVQFIQVGGGAGGSIWLTAGSLSGSGTVRAQGGDGLFNSHSSAGGGGRVSVVLTGSSGVGGVDISARGGFGLRHDGAAGTIYREDVGQSDGRGTVHVINNRSNAFARTYLPPELSPELSNDLARAIVSAEGIGSLVEISTNSLIKDIFMYTNTYLVLSNQLLYVNSAEHHLGSTKRGKGNTNRVDHYDQVIWIGLPKGTVFSIW